MFVENSITYAKYLKEQKYWPLQIIQDEYGRALNIPLRICDLSEIKKDKPLHQFYRDNTVCHKQFSSEVELAKYIQNVATRPLAHLKELEKDKDIWQPFFSNPERKHYWLTRQNSGYSLVQSLHEHPLWQWWEFFFYYYQFVVMKEPGTTEIKVVPFFEGGKNDKGEDKHLYVAFTLLPFEHCQQEHRECVLVAGPVWYPINIMTGSDFEEHRVKPFVKSFCEVIGQANSDKFDLIRLGSNSFPILPGDMQQRLRTVSTGLQQLLAMSLPANNILHRCDHVKLAEWSLFTLHLEKRLPEELVKQMREPGKMVGCRLDHPYSNREGSALPWVITDFASSQPFPSYLTYCDTLDHLQEPLCFCSLDEDSQKDFLDAFMGYLNQLFEYRNKRRMELLLVLREFLSDNFNFLTASLKESDKIEKVIEESYDKFCYQIANWLVAERVVIYYYNHGTTQLKILGFHSTTKLETENAETKRKYSLQMKAVASSSEQRQQSICYRCVDEHKTKFTRVFDPDTGESVPSGEPLLSFPELLESSRSAIATPILVGGRILGVLELNGVYPYQFCWENKKFSQDLAKVFGLFFYNNHLLTQLRKLNQKLHQSGKDTKQIYDNIAHRLAVIFLSHSACLWIRSQNQFEQKGWRSKLTEGSLTQLGQFVRKNGLIDNIFGESAPPYYQEEIGGKGNTYFDSTTWENTLSTEFRENKLKHVCIIPFYKPDTSQKGINDLMGCVFLYNQAGDTEGNGTLFDDRWSLKVKFVQEYMALLLEAMHMQQAREKHHSDMSDMVAHDMERDARMIAGRAKDFSSQIHHYLETQKTSPQQFDSIIQQVKTNCSKEVQEQLINRLTALKNDFQLRIEKRSQLNMITHDLKNHAGSLSKKISEFSEGETSQPNRDFLDTVQIESMGKVDLREELKTISHSYQNLKKSKGMFIDHEEEGKWTWQDDLHHYQLFLRMDKEEFRKILGNLFDNAIKYAKPHTAIETKLTEGTYNLKLTISNVAPCLLEKEENRIYEKEFRGIRAKESGMEGKGMGLYIVKKYCDLYEIALDYRPETQTQVTGDCKHIFILSFPLKMVEKSKL